MGYIERNEIKKEILTKERIIQDIKYLYGWEIKCYLPCVLFALLGFLVLWFVCDLGDISNLNTIMIIIVTLYLMLLIGATSYLVYLIKSYFSKDIKYSIEIDEFTNLGLKKYGLNLFNSELCLCFKCGRKFILHSYYKYYNWSEYYRTNYREIIKYSMHGDEFNLIIRNNRVVNAYKRNCFELDDN